MKLAVFDLDHTLLPIDCEWGWVEYMLAAGGESDVVTIYRLRDQLYRDYAEGKLDYDAFGDFQMEILARFPRQSLDRWIEDYASRCINPVITEAARNLVESHRKAEDILVLCTAAYGYIAQPIARLFGIEHVLSAEAEIGVDGEFTGRAEGPHNFSTNKPMRLQRFIDAVQTDNRSLEALSFYSDSASDMPMFDFTAKHHCCPNKT